MSAPLIPVDRTKREDVHYRYKMPAMLVKIESGGNGVKTVFPNIHDVCDAIKRSEIAILKHLSVTFGAMTKVTEKDDKYFQMGSRSQEEIQKQVYDFIDLYVLCKECKNPETMVVENAGGVHLKCASCGKSTTVLSDGKNGPVLRELTKSSARYTSETQGNAAQKFTTPVASQVAANTSKLDLTGSTNEKPKDFLSDLARVLKARPIVKAEVQRQFVCIASECDFKHVEDYARVLFRAATLDTDKSKCIDTLRDIAFLYLNLYVSKASSENVFKETLLMETFRYVNLNDLAHKLPMFLKMFFDEKMLSAKDIIMWTESLSSNKKVKASPEAIANMKTSLADLIAWFSAGVKEENPAPDAEADQPAEVAVPDKAATKQRKGPKVKA